jgi:transcriptional regulator with XRE-family HTH domain
MVYRPTMTELESVRKRRGDTFEALGHRAGVDPATAYRVVMGKTKNPRRDTVVRLAAALGISVRRLRAAVEAGEFRDRDADS